MRFHDLPDTFSGGSDKEEAIFNAAEALSGMLAWRIDNDQPVPDPTHGLAGAVYISPNANVQAALLVHKARDGKPLADLARALESSWPAAKRLEDPHHWPTLRQLDKAAAALGKRLVLTFE